jgi:hypothetical protein
MAWFDEEERKEHLVGNSAEFDRLTQKVLGKAAERKALTLESEGRTGDPTHYYDDDITTALAEGFSDRIVVIPVIGDAIRALGGLLRRRTELSGSVFVQRALEALSQKDFDRYDIAKLTKVAAIRDNSLQPFMNGGPADENWNNSPDGFYDWIGNKSKESILGIELGFKADEYGLAVAQRLIAKKSSNPGMYIGILMDGFVSILMQKPQISLTQFEQNTVDMIVDMNKAGIDVVINSSSDPLSHDFFAANHVKLWVFDATAAFFGGIGIESQFINREYDEMDLVFGEMVQVLTFVALLLLNGQRSYENVFFDIKRNEISLDEIKRLFLKAAPPAGKVQMELRMDVPGYVQDAQKEYIHMLTRDDLFEVYILVPYFSDHKVAKGLVRTAARLYKQLYKDRYDALSAAGGHTPSELGQLVNEQLLTEKRIHVVFPTKQEDAIIADVSKYYSYYLRNNPIVETRQFIYQTPAQTFNMLHAKQMVVTLVDPTRNWTKYVKYGGSYNPAGRAWNMWEVNATEILGDWKDSDEGPNAPAENPIRDYLENVMKAVVQKYTLPFVWGTADVKLTPWDRVSMFVARHLWF